MLEEMPSCQDLLQTLQFMKQQGILPVPAAAIPSYPQWRVLGLTPDDTQLTDLGAYELPENSATKVAEAYRLEIPILFNLVEQTALI